MKSLIPVLLITAAVPLSAENTFYARHFNTDENLGNDKPISGQNWNAHYGASATVAEGDANMAVAISNGGDAADELALTQFQNSKDGRGFFYCSGSDSLAFAPGAWFAWTNQLTTNTAGVQGENGGSIPAETDWGTLSDEPLAGLKLSELASLGANFRTRNVSKTVRLAFQLDGSTWYVDATGYLVTQTAVWEAYEIADVQAMTVYDNVNFVPGVSMETDLDDGSGTTVAVASLNPNAEVTAYGVYVDTDAFAGNDSWMRIDDLYVATTNQLEIPAPTVETISAGGTNFQTDISSRFSIFYTLERTTDLGVAFSPVNSSITVGTGSTISLTDSENLLSSSDDAFYRVTTAFDQN